MTQPMLYADLYRCMYCAGAVLERGVKSFVQPGPGQTVPVSHFGHIRKAKIWLIATNPKGDREDTNVGFRPQNFISRSELTTAQIGEIFDHFSEYFDRANHNTFFQYWIKLLNGLKVGGVPHTWEAGGICCVDLIKCPSQGRWKDVVRPPDKNLVYGCFKESEPRRYLKRQVDLHAPRVLIFSAGLGQRQYYAENCKQNKNSRLRLLWPENIKQACTGVWSVPSPARLSIGLAANKLLQSTGTDELRSAIQATIEAWEKENVNVT